VSADLDGAFVCIQRAARRMIAAGRGGRIIAVTSVHEHQPRVGSSAYDAAKHGLGGLIKTAALELGQHGITCNAVAPGEIGDFRDDPARSPEGVRLRSHPRPPGWTRRCPRRKGRVSLAGVGRLRRASAAASCNGAATRSPERSATAGFPLKSARRVNLNTLKTTEIIGFPCLNFAGV
jgi:NAD(P)-dependent dehydrogenase (short-subunit alcohol dehydrogenase family)